MLRTLYVVNPKGCVVMVDGIIMDLSVLRALGCATYTDLDLDESNIVTSELRLYIDAGVIMKSNEFRAFEALDVHGNAIDIDSIHGYIAQLEN